MKALRIATLLLIGVGAFGAYVAVGFYRVEPEEQAIELFLGRYRQTVEPGLHWHAWGIERVEKRRVTRLIEEEFGFRTQGEGTARSFDERPEEKRMLTGDTNVVDVEFVVQYRIRDLKDYLFSVEQVPDVIRSVAQAAVREIVARNNIDRILTIDKEIIGSQSRQRIQEILDGYGAGVSIDGLQLQDVDPPEEVKAAFNDVTTGEQDSERMELEAKGYAAQILPRANAEATEVTNEAEAYAITRVAAARGEASKFLALLTEYRRSPEVTRERLYLETFEAILPHMDKIIIQEGQSERVLPYLPIGKRGARP